MTSASINLPRLRLAHPPNLDLPVIRGGDDERESWVEGSPVDAAVVAFEHIFDCREVVERIERAGSGVGGIFPETRDVPYAHCLVLRR